MLRHKEYITRKMDKVCWDFELLWDRYGVGDLAFSLVTGPDKHSVDGNDLFL